MDFERKDQGRLEGRDLLADSVYSSVSSGEPSVEISPKPHQANDTLVGPTLGMELPVFDQNQGGIARARYSYEQSRKQLDGLRRQVLQEVRLANARARTACDIVRYYRDEVLPVREASLELSRTAYQSGRTALLNVLETERAVLSARAGYVDSLRASAAAVVELKRRAASRLCRSWRPWQGMRPLPSRRHSRSPASNPHQFSQGNQNHEAVAGSSVLRRSCCRRGSRRRGMYFLAGGQEPQRKSVGKALMPGEDMPARKGPPRRGMQATDMRRSAW